MQRLLVLSCSQRKRPDLGLLPAVERYNGPAFQVLRKFLRTCLDKKQFLDVFILSAEFGLIPFSQPIPFYDRRMTPHRANELRAQVLAELNTALQNDILKKLLISVSNDYLRALSGYEQLIPEGINVIVSMGTQGRKLSELHDWLYDGAPPQRDSTGGVRRGKAMLRGVELTLPPEQVLDVARRALDEGRGNATSYESWYVEVDGIRVAPKWLVSQLTGLPLSAYHTSDAILLLRKLGVNVYRV